jgi:tetratricopeptide (TPR) repeat protein
MLVGCSGGPDEKPVSDSISSPAKLLDNGIYHYSINNYPKAINQFEKALLQYRSIDNQAGIANSCLNLAKTYMAINNNQLAAEYLVKADVIIENASLDDMNEHLSLLKSSLAINNALYDQALLELDQVLTSKNAQIKLAALKNRNVIAFAKNDTDKKQWLEKYKSLQTSHPENTQSHAARILRFEAETTVDTEKQVELLTRSLSISQNLATRTAIAATLAQWAEVNIEMQQYDQAEDKYLRALFIRHQLSDVKNSLLILKQLQIVYAKTDKEKAALASGWASKLSNHELSDWDQLFSDFETFPGTE